MVALAPPVEHDGLDGWRGRHPAMHMLTAPLATGDVELTDRVPPIDRPTLLLARLHRHPVGVVLVDPEGGRLSGSAVEEKVWHGCRPIIDAHLRHDRIAPVADVSGLRRMNGAVPLCARRRTELAAGARPVSVIVATRERPVQLRRCLDALLQLNHPCYEIIVVDNDPITDRTREMVEKDFPSERVSYLREDTRGLAAAHNCGIRAARGEILAFVDDDTIADPEWLIALSGGFSSPSVAAVTGLIHSSELRTRAQLLLEQHGGFGKGFVPRLFDLDRHRPADPLFPLSVGQLGSGANMAFEAGILRALGGFHPAMGTGTPARGGDDLAAFFSIIVAGYQIAYEPSAVVFHEHHDDDSSLGRQSFGYGVGLGAYLTHAACTEPRVFLTLSRHFPAALAKTISLNSPRNQRRYAGWPRELSRLERRGILVGPAAYAASRWRARRRTTQGEPARLPSWLLRSGPPSRSHPARNGIHP